MRSGVIIFFFLYSGLIFSQKIVWENCIGEDKYDYVRKILKTNNDDYLIVANEYLANSSNAYLVRIDSSGKIKWKKTYPVLHETEFESAVEDTDSGFLIVATSKDIDSIIFKGQKDIVLIKIEKNGKYLWSKTYGGSKDDIASDILKIKNNLYILGNSNSNDKDLSGNNGGKDVWFIKTDSIGNILWSYNYGSVGDEGANSFCHIKKDSSFIIVGSADSATGDIRKRYTDTSIYNCRNGYILKLNNQGKRIWHNTYGGRNDDIFNHITSIDDDEYIVIGNSRSNDFDVVLNHGTMDGWAIKFKDTSVIWNKALGGSSIDRLNHVAVYDNNKNLIVSGYSQSTDGDVRNDSLNSDGWVFIIDSLARIKWQYVFGYNVWSIGYESDIIDFVETQKKHYVFASTSNACDSGSHYWRPNVWIFETYVNDSATCTNANVINISLIILYPNPATNSIHLSGISNQSAIEIRDMQGRMLRAMNHEELKINDNIDISTFVKGMYILTVKNAEGVWAGKFVKE